MLRYQVSVCFVLFLSTNGCHRTGGIAETRSETSATDQESAECESTCLAQSGQNKIDTDRSLASGIRVHCGGRTFDIDHIASGTDTRSITFAGNRLDKGTVVCSVGYGIMAKGLTMIDPGFDPGDCVVFINTATGQFERTAYHTPRPDFLSSSPDGMYVGMARQALLPKSGSDYFYRNPPEGLMAQDHVSAKRDAVVSRMISESWPQPRKIPFNLEKSERLCQRRRTRKNLVKNTLEPKSGCSKS